MTNTDTHSTQWHVTYTSGNTDTHYYFRAYSNYGKEIKKLFYEKYQIPDVFDNPLCAVIARIEFVQRTEPRSVGFDPG